MLRARKNTSAFLYKIVQKQVVFHCYSYNKSKNIKEILRMVLKNILGIVKKKKIDYQYSFFSLSLKFVIMLDKVNE